MSTAWPGYALMDGWMALTFVGAGLAAGWVLWIVCETFRDLWWPRRR